MVLKFGSLIFLFVVSVAEAGRPVFESLTRDQLIERSDFVFSGYPSPQPTSIPCAHEMGRWQVHKVYRGDQRLEGKIISLADHGYRFFAGAADKGQKPPSYRAFRFRTGELNREASTSFLFTRRNPDGCFELAAQGAQEHRFAEPEMDALMDTSPDCASARRGFDFRVGTFAKNCAQDSDCDLFYLHPSACERPYVLSKAARPQVENEEFQSLQGKVRIACPQQPMGQSTAACAPIAIPFCCKGGHCEAGRSTALPGGGKPNFTTATVAESCAPHDALSAMIVIREAAAEYPMVSINWWGGKKPTRSGGTFVLQSKGTDAFADGYQGSYCPYKGGCNPLKKITLKLILKPGETKGLLEFSVVTGEGETLSGTLPIKFTAAGRVLCG